MWDDIATLSRYLLMLSFNNCLDVANHLPYLFHIVTLLVHIGPISLRASIHGLVINIIHSLCTCTKPSFSGETQRVLRLSLDEFSLSKFYLLFGISDVKSAAVIAFRTVPSTNCTSRNPVQCTNSINQEPTGVASPSNTTAPPTIATAISSAAMNTVSAIASTSTTVNTNVNTGSANPSTTTTSGHHHHEPKLPLNSLETITDALLEIMEACMKNIPDCDWLQRWTEMARSFAFRYNPALQPRSIIVFGCISKSISDYEIIQLLRILVKALESFQDLQLIESIIVCLTRLQPLLTSESPIHRALFWVAISVLQLDETSLYASGLALLEQNLHTLDSFGTFDSNTLKNVMMTTREPLEWHFKQLDHSVGLSFMSNFHCALVGHLIKGFRHTTPTTVSRTTRVLNMLLEIVAKPHKRDKFEVNLESAPYLSALISVSEEVQSRVHLRHKVSRNFLDRTSSKTFQNEVQPVQAAVPLPNGVVTKSFSSPVGVSSGSAVPTQSPTPLPTPSTLMNLPLSSYITQNHPVSFYQNYQIFPNSVSSHSNTPTSGKQKSIDSNFYLPVSSLKGGKSPLKPHFSNQISTAYQTSTSVSTSEEDKHWKSLDIDSSTNSYRPLYRTQRSSSMPTPKTLHKTGESFLASKNENADFKDKENGADEDSKQPQQPPQILTATVPVTTFATTTGKLEKQESKSMQSKKQSRLSVSNENNILLDPEVLSDFQNQALILTILVSLQ